MPNALPLKQFSKPYGVVEYEDFHKISEKKVVSLAMGAIAFESNCHIEIFELDQIFRFCILHIQIVSGGDRLNRLLNLNLEILAIL